MSFLWLGDQNFNAYSRRENTKDEEKKRNRTRTRRMRKSRIRRSRTRNWRTKRRRERDEKRNTVEGVGCKEGRVREGSDKAVLAWKVCWEDEKWVLLDLVRRVSPLYLFVPSLSPSSSPSFFILFSALSPRFLTVYLSFLLLSFFIFIPLFPSSVFFVFLSLCFSSPCFFLTSTPPPVFTFVLSSPPPFFASSLPHCLFSLPSPFYLSSLPTLFFHNLLFHLLHFFPVPFFRYISSFSFPFHI